MYENMQDPTTNETTEIKPDKGRTRGIEGITYQQEHYSTTSRQRHG